MRARTWRIAAITTVFAATLPGLAFARPADVTIVNSSPIPVSISGTPTVKIDPSANQVQVTGQPISVVPQLPQKFAGYADANATTTGGKACTPVPIAPGRAVRLESVAATTYSDAGATAYLKFLAKLSGGASRILVQRVPIVATGTDPVTDTRSGILAIPMHLVGGSSADAGLGEVHSLSVCVQSAAGAAAASSWVVTGTYE